MENETYKKVVVLIPKSSIALLKELVDLKMYPSVSEAIRIAIRDLILSEHPKYKHRKVDNDGEKNKKR
ncbi:MAG: CopG family transcriptional regulator [Candidatus Bathyarchaeia archaeon]